MIPPRLAAHMRIEALKRLTQGAGGFATVVKKGDAVSGAILVIRTIRGGQNTVLERISNLDGSAHWQEIWTDNAADIANKGELSAYLARRGTQDPDLWAIELDVANAAQLDAILGQCD
ncbi:DUF1491 family protein [Blastomonas sp.]|uniref:DUF1491 family protein n=1 Tax=Blastomonas sp. TaxID=1909299 RepID=UPI003594885F